MAFVPVGKLSYHRITHNMFIAKFIINVDEQIAATASAIAANAVLECIPVKVGDTVLQAWFEVYTACTGGASADIGVDTDVDCFVDGAPLDQTAIDTTVVAGSNGPHYFATANTIDMTVLEAAVTAGKFAVCALIVRI